jgi:hypothetical protein
MLLATLELAAYQLLELFWVIVLAITAYLAVLKLPELIRISISNSSFCGLCTAGGAE